MYRRSYQVFTMVLHNSTSTDHGVTQCYCTRDEIEQKHYAKVCARSWVSS